MKKSQDILVGDQYALFEAVKLETGGINNTKEAEDPVPAEQAMLFDIAPLERYDTKDAKEGDVLMVQTDRGRHVFIKEGEHARTLEGWRREDAERVLGVVTRLALCEPNKYGASIRTNTVVMSAGQELTSIDTEGESTERQARNLGLIAGMTLQRFPDKDQESEIDFEHSRHIVAA